MKRARNTEKNYIFFHNLYLKDYIVPCREGHPEVGLNCTEFASSRQTSPEKIVVSGSLVRDHCMF